MIDLHNMSILIVDDMKSMRKSIIGMLKTLKFGKPILVAENGREAWNVLKDTPVDLIVLDWNMPVMRGSKLLDLIRNDRKLRDMPVIMITGQYEKTIITEVAESDIDAYLLKPLTIEALGKKIKGVINFANDPPLYARHLLKAREFEEKGDLPAAVIETLAALKEKRLSKILRKLGMLYTKTGQPEMTEKCLLKAVAINKDDATSRYFLGRWYFKSGKLTHAIRFYSQAMVRSHSHIEEVVDLGHHLLKNRMTTQAVEIFNNIIKHSKTKLYYCETIIDIYIKNSEYEYARELLGMIRKGKPERYSYWQKQLNDAME